jgi:putative ABC transport system permease protein
MGSSKGNGSGLRNGLVVFQFAISMVLIVSTVLVYSQLRYMQQKNLGFDKSQVLILENANALGRNANILMADLQKDARVESATRSNYLPLPGRNRENAILSTQKAAGESDKVFQRWQVDANYLPTLGIKIKQGRNFDPAFITDSTAIIINETAAKELGLADPIGKILYTSKTKEVQSKAEDFEALTIIGVVQDFHFESLHDNISGLYVQLSNTEGPISVRLKPGDAAGVIAGIERNWQRFNPDRALSYHFMDETLNRVYASEQRIGLIALVFALLSILVSCLGLFGLAAFTTEQRTKEIGVRKVLGASVASITGLLAQDFLKLVLVAIVLACPLAYYFMQQWLADFAYRIDIQWWMFVGAALAAVAIAFATVSFQSIKAAMANPITSLRNE